MKGTGGEEKMEEADRAQVCTWREKGGKKGTDKIKLILKQQMV